MTLAHLDDRNIILGSGSPRRAELLKIMGLNYTKRVSDIEEKVPDGLPITHHAAYLSQLKSDALRDTLQPDELLITADTTVIVGDTILNKPLDEADAIRMIDILQGTTHEVITGLTVADQQRSITIDDMAEVHFREMDMPEISTYIKSWRPMDKAGAYGIQDWIGLAVITKIVGSYYTIMGLPTHRLYDLLKEWT